MRILSFCSIAFSMMAVVCAGEISRANIYEELAKATGGKVTHSTKEDFMKAVYTTSRYEMAKEAPLVFKAQTNLIVGKTASFSFPLETAPSGLLIIEIISSESKTAKVTLHDPQRKQVAPVTATQDPRAAVVVHLTDRVVVMVPQPQSGNWSVQLNGPSAALLQVRMQGPARVRQARFVRTGGRPGHQGEFQYSGPLKAGDREKFRFSVFEVKPQSLRLTLVAEDGHELDRHSGPDISNDELAEIKLKIPSVPFRILVQGKMQDGSEFQRLLDQRFQPVR